MTARASAASVASVASGPPAGRVDVHGGIIQRGLDLFGLIQKIGATPSDAELTGLLGLLPADVARNLAALLGAGYRDAGMVLLDTLREWLFAARDARAEGKKVVLVPFNFPPDLVHAFEGLVPLTTELLTTVASVALPGGAERYWDLMQSLGLPDHVCSANSVEIASALSGLDLEPDAIISAAPGACDANSKVHELLSQWAGIPQYLLEVPVDDTPEGKAVYGAYFRQLIGQLETLSGEALDTDRLRQVVTLGNRCTELYWELFELRKQRPLPVPNVFNLFLSAVRFAAWGTPAAVRLLEAMVDTARARHEGGIYPAPEERVRVMWAYTSYYFDLEGLHRWMERRGYSFLADVLSFYAPQPIDDTDREAMIDGLVTAAWDYPMNRQMGRSSMSAAWVEDIVFASRELGADCVIYCGHDACKQTWSVVSILGEELRKRAGIPLLVLHGDSWLRTTTPMGVLQQEIEEFVQNVVLRKKRPRRRVRRRGPAAAPESS